MIDSSYVLYVERNLKRLSPDSVIKFTTDNMFVTGITCVIKSALDSFMNNYAPILYVDGSFTVLSAKILGVCFIDANHMLQPVAIHICGEESEADYATLFGTLCQLGLKELDKIIIHSDAHKAIEGATMIFSEYHVEVSHVLCVAHIMKNVANALKDQLPSNPDMYTLFRKYYYYARRAGTREINESWMEKIRELSPIAYDYLDKNGRSSFMYTFTEPHYLQDTNNPAECLMSLLKMKDENGQDIRSSNVFAMVHQFVKLTMKRMKERRESLSVSKVYPDCVHRDDPLFCEFLESYILSLGYKVEICGYNYRVIDECTVEDRYWGESFKVDFEEKTCTCGVFQQMQVPCEHAIRLLHHRNEYWKILWYVNDCYKISNVLTCCPEIDPDYESILDEGLDDVLHKRYRRIPDIVKRMKSYRIGFWSKVRRLKARYSSIGEETAALYSGSGNLKRKHSSLNKLRTDMIYSN